MSKKMSKKIMIVVGIMAVAIGTTALSAQYLKRVDEISYTFKVDEEVLGPWTVVDFVEKESDFKPGEKSWQGEEYLRLMEFKSKGVLTIAIEEDGNILEFESPVEKWTEDAIINEQNQTNSAYTIKEIDGTNYMFYEWKSGDYSYRGQEPYLYVLEQGRNIESVEATGKVDDTNVPFVNDDAMKGTWVAVDFVKNIEDFKVGVQQFPELYLDSFVLKDEGNMEITFEGQVHTPMVAQEYWTEGAIVSKVNQTVSACVIKEIEGESYMFYEWKSGDYTIRGMEPYYYVLKKQ